MCQIQQYQIIIQRQTMKRTHSALSLKNIAQSIHRSIQLHAHRNQPDPKMNSYRSQSHLLIKDQQKRQDEGKISRQQKQNRIFILEKQIVALERQLESSKSTIRNYSKELAEYQHTNTKIKDLQSRMTSQRQIMNQISNQIQMLKEEVNSSIFNAEGRVAEKEYYEQLVEAYERQYEPQSKKVLKIIRLEETISSLQKEIQQLSFQICYAQENVEQWKEQNQFDLNEHKIRNSLKIARVELIQLEDACDQHCAQYNLRKLRELCCSFFKSYAHKNGIKVEQAHQGADIYICRHGLVQDFTEFVKQRIVYNKPECTSLNKYFQTLNKIETIYAANRRLGSKKLHDDHLKQMRILQETKEQKTATLSQVRQKLKFLNRQLQSEFSEQSLAVIEYLRQRNKNIYDIKEIKAKLKQNNKEQNRRITQIKEAFRSAKHLETVIAAETHQQLQLANQKSIDALVGQLQMHQERMEQMKKQKAKLDREKDTIQTLISNAVSKWRERDENKAKLKSLFDELKQTKQAKSYGAVNKNQPDTSRFQGQKKQDDIGLNNSQKYKNFSRKQSTFSLEQSRSILSLSNPYKKIMDRQITNYKPIIEDCQMIVSKKLPTNNKESRPFTICDLQESRVLQQLSQNKSTRRAGKSTTYNDRASSKQNPNALKNKSQNLTQTKHSANYKASVVGSMVNRGKMSESQRLSLSKLLISKFNR